MLVDNGILSTYDLDTGERIYRTRVDVGSGFSASPIAVDGKIYFASEDGDPSRARVRMPRANRNGGSADGFSGRFGRDSDFARPQHTLRHRPIVILLLANARTR